MSRFSIGLVLAAASLGAPACSFYTSTGAYPGNAYPSNAYPSNAYAGAPPPVVIATPVGSPARDPKPVDHREDNDPARADPAKKAPGVSEPATEPKKPVKHAAVPLRFKAQEPKPDPEPVTSRKPTTTPKRPRDPSPAVDAKLAEAKAKSKPVPRPRKPRTTPARPAPAIARALAKLPPSGQRGDK